MPPSDTPMNRQMMKDRVFLEIAVTLGQLGTCTRAAVGAVITRNGRAISWGYNGAPPGTPHCEENDHGWRGEYKDFSDTGRRKMQAIESLGCRNATHAEANAIAFAARQGISTEGGTLYVERSPCDVCARLCIAAGISRVVYLTPYRDESPITLLREAGLEVECIA